MKLPDYFYSSKIFDGYQEPPPPFPLIERFIGEDVAFSVFLNFDGEPISFDNWGLKAVVKQNRQDHQVIWEGIEHNGIYPKSPVGNFLIHISANKTKTWLPGTYWMDVQAKEKVGKNKDYDRTGIVASFGFTLRYSTFQETPVFVREEITSGTTPYLFDISKL